MLLLKNKSESIQLETDGKVDVYASWHDRRLDGVTVSPDSILTVMGGGGKQTVVDMTTDDVAVRSIMQIIVSCRDQKDVSVRFTITDGNAEVQLFTALLGPDKNARYSNVGGFVAVP